MKLLEKAIPAGWRELLADAVYRLLGLTCRSTFKPPHGAVIAGTERYLDYPTVYRCVGRPGHAGHHGCAGAAWPSAHEVAAHPGEEVLLRTSHLVRLLRAEIANGRNLSHVILFTAEGAERSVELSAILASDEPDLDRARELAADWVKINEHLMSCGGIEAHLRAPEGASESV